MSEQPLQKREEIEKRHQKIMELLNEFGSLITNKSMADSLGVSESTIEKDLSEIRKTGWNWIYNLSKEGYVYECRMSFEKLASLERRIIKALNEMERGTIKTNSPEQYNKMLVSLSHALSRVTATKMGIIQQPTLYALRLAVKKFHKEEAQLEDLLADP